MQTQNAPPTFWSQFLQQPRPPNQYVNQDVSAPENNIHFINSNRTVLSAIYQSSTNIRTVGWACRRLSEWLIMTDPLTGQETNDWCLWSMRSRRPLITLEERLQAPENYVDPPEEYVILSLNGEPVNVQLIPPAWTSLLINYNTKRVSLTKECRKRDKTAVIGSTFEKRPPGDYTALDTAHIVPRTLLFLWIHFKMDQKVRDNRGTDLGPAKIDSLDNVFLIDKCTHHALDNWKISIDVDGGYPRVLVHTPGYWWIDGEYLRLDSWSVHGTAPHEEAFRLRLMISDWLHCAKSIWQLIPQYSIPKI